jgi:cytidylate kinase
LVPEALVSVELRTQAVAQAASKAAVIPEVRAALVAFQQSFAQRGGGAVLDGRDIGTVICPQADAKLFVTASAEKRAERRYVELKERGADVELSQVIEDVQQRDKRDRERETAPLIAAQNAIEIDTSDLTIEQAIATAIEKISAKIA